MGKFSGSSARPTHANLTAPVTTTEDLVPTFEGGVAYQRNPESDLFLLAITNMVGEDTFYESSSTRDKRFLDLVHEVTKYNPEFILGNPEIEGKIGFASYLRTVALMRSASTMLAAEYLRAGGPHARRVINAVCQRPDEPAEILAYWQTNYGRRLPSALRRGLADAVRRLYTERSVLRYDGQAKNIRFADVIELVHPRPIGTWQESLFKYLLDQRHHQDGTVDKGLLPILSAAKDLDRMSGDEIRSFIRANGAEVLSDAGYSWERLSGKMKMDAEAWSMIIGSMAPMALVRNLRNFDQAGIDDNAIDTVITKITDPEQVRRSRIFPYQVWSAYKHAPSDNWKRALGKTLDAATSNIPENLDGTLVVIDTSGSMEGTVSGKSQMRRVEVAAVMAAATAHGRQNTDVVIFGASNKRIDVRPGQSTLTTVDHVVSSIGSVGHSTSGHTAIRDHFDPKRHRRAVIFTDDQMHDSGLVRLDHVPTIYTYNLAGYAPSSQKSGEKGRYTLGGFSDGTFTMMSVLEAGKAADWPF